MGIPHPLTAYLSVCVQLSPIIGFNSAFPRLTANSTAALLVTYGTGDYLAVGSACTVYTKIYPVRVMVFGRNRCNSFWFFSIQGVVVVIIRYVRHHIVSENCNVNGFFSQFSMRKSPKIVNAEFFKVSGDGISGVIFFLAYFTFQAISRGFFFQKLTNTFWCNKIAT